MTYQKATPQQRAQAIIDYYRDLPGEFAMLKGVLCLSQALRAGAEKRGAGWQQARDEQETNIDLTMIAHRMDEINNTIIAHALESSRPARAEVAAVVAIDKAQRT